MHLQLIFRVSLALVASSPLAVVKAQEAIPLEEDFLLFLADGMDVDGEWKDPMTLANLSEIDQIPSDELVWLAQQSQSEYDKTQLEVMTADVVESRSIDGEENE